MPDEFIFSSLATLEELSIAVKKGSLTESQKQRFESAHNHSNSSNNPDEEGKSTIVPANNRQPICPWFFCCY
jgi:hypothetical protein